MTDSAAGKPTLEQQLFDQWPDGLRALFDGTSLVSKIGFTASLLTTDTIGHLRTSLLGIGELYAPDSRSLCIALWPQARCARALAQNRRAALTFVFDDAFYQVQLEFVPLPVDDDARDASAGLVCFRGSIDMGEAQRVRYARLTSGITFALEEGKDATLERWMQQIDYLKRAAGRSS
ncbi:hypothetical protein [Paraburkholderia rhizosphaerae]|uniref:Pyridoxamine 5'-phosphate oxidase putative domain-containing protein n=1 Tax=Paraburkholderia rhizosphaerae TaxID=480658 RepID=A0A4R8LZ32_9BURK|nr:hypothetical protein [Paraburkholderia rhizosphaerae]TDY53332.1 hypothetical protein BX592_103143 [Paraburkholderia rhizosphaerae]